MWRAFRRSKKDRCSGTRGALSGYVDGRLNPEEEARIEEHLNTCRGCREDLESLRATVALLRHLPEVMPSRSFALAPVKSLPWRTVLPGLRFATAAAVLLLAAAFAVDWSGAFEGGIVFNPRYDSDALGIWGAGTSEEGDSYWVVAGVENNIDVVSQTRVELVVPDGTDNVSVAVDSVAGDGVVYGAMKSVPGGVPQLVLTKDGNEVGTWGEVKAYSMVSASDVEPDRYATNDTETMGSILYAIMKEQDGAYLNMVPASSDNNLLYSFNLGEAKREVKPADNDDWLLALEYGLIALVAFLGSATAALWLRQRRARAAEANKG